MTDQAHGLTEEQTERHYRPAHPLGADRARTDEHLHLYNEATAALAADGDRHTSTRNDYPGTD